MTATIDPNHEPLKRAVYLTDSEWRQIVAVLREADPYYLTELIEKQLSRSS